MLGSQPCWIHCYKKNVCWWAQKLVWQEIQLELSLSLKGELYSWYILYLFVWCFLTFKLRLRVDFLYLYFVVLIGIRLCCCCCCCSCIFCSPPYSYDMLFITWSYICQRLYSVSTPTLQYMSKSYALLDLQM